MSFDLETQLDEYGTFHDNGQAAITLDEIVTGRASILVPALPIHPPGRWIAIAAGLATVIVASASVWVIGSTGGIAPAEEPSTTASTAPKPVEGVVIVPPSDEVVGDGPVIAWTHVEAPPGGYIQFSDGATFYTFDGATLMASTDGIEWEKTLTQSTVCARLCGSPIAARDGFVLLAGGGGAIRSEKPRSFTPLPVEVGLSTVEEFRTPGDPIEMFQLPPPENGGTGWLMGSAVGPKGAVVAYVTVLAGEDFAFRYLGIDDLASNQIAGGVFYATRQDGSTESIRLSDLGLTEEDVDNEITQLWHSPPNGAWELAATLDRSEVWPVATAEGFYAFTSPETLFSTDGREWVTLDGPGSSCCGLSAQSRHAWQDGVLVHNTDGLLHITREDVRPLTMMETIGNAFHFDHWVETSVSGMGILAVDREHLLVLYSPDGIEWSVSPLPTEMSGGTDSLLHTGRISVLGTNDTYILQIAVEDGPFWVWRGTTSEASGS